VSRPRSGRRPGSRRVWARRTGPAYRDRRRSRPTSSRYRHPLARLRSVSPTTASATPASAAAISWRPPPCANSPNPMAPASGRRSRHRPSPPGSPGTTRRPGRAPRCRGTAARPPSATWADDASPSTVAGTATTRQKPGRHSLPPDAASPPGSRQPASPSAILWPPVSRPAADQASPARGTGQGPGAPPGRQPDETAKPKSLIYMALACYRASWQLPGPDFHRQATTSLRT